MYSDDNSESISDNGTEINNPKEPVNPQKKKFWKFWVVMFFLNLGFLLVFYRLLMIQVVNVEEYYNKAKKQHQSRINLSADRGSIYDRNGKVISSNIESASIAVDPRHLKNKKRVVAILEKNYGLSASKLLRKINDSESSFVWLARGVDPSLSKELEKLNDKGVIIIREPRRIYHYAGIGSQIIGFCDIDNNGLSGIELKWDSLLKGKPGFMIVNRDGLGRLRPAADLPLVPAKNGNSIKLTLDIELQRIVENELKKGVVEGGAESGTLVAIEPKTGEILAMASYPGYDPEDVSKHSTASMRCRAITDVYEPGSTFKLVTAAAAIEENIVNENDMFNGHQGVLEFKNYTIRDVHGYGMITFRHAMEVSSNVILSTVASKIPDYNFYKYIRDFGFGLEYGVEIPGEVGGRLKKPADFNQTSKRYMGFGYGLSATALQMANAYSTVANGGELMKPYFVKSVFNDETSEEVYSAKPTKIRRVISDKTAKRLTNILEGIVSNGTGKTALVKGMPIAGKTGTSQQIVEGKYSKMNYNASFAGYFPANNPKLAMIIVIDKPRSSIYGGAIAAPIFKNITLRWSAINSSIYDSDSTIIADSSIIVRNDSVSVPQLIGFSADSAKKIAQKFNLKTSILTSNKIILSQSPSPFTKVKKGSMISLQLARNNDSLNKQIQLSGLSLRRALTLLNDMKFKARVFGSGIVKQVVWNKDLSRNECILYCE